MHQWIGSLSHDLQGVIHLNMHLHFWFPDEGFPTQYRHRQCSFYRVCLTCEQRKPCARCKEKNAQPNIRLRRGKRATQIVASAERAPRSRAGAGPAELAGKCCHTRVLRLSDGDDLPGKTERKCAISVCKQQSSNPLQQWQPSDCPAAVRENATKKSGTKSDVRLQPW